MVWGVGCRDSPLPADSHYQSTLDAVYVYVVPWTEFPIVPSYPHYQQAAASAKGCVRVRGFVRVVDEVNMDLDRIQGGV